MRWIRCLVPHFLEIKTQQKRSALSINYCREEYDKMQKDPEILLSPRESVAMEQVLL